ncbi:hypothetical protein AtEden1_Chr1g0042281 [Arabidopsis thaliana]
MRIITDETRDRYDKAFLMMITYQCDALVDKFNVTPLIIREVKDTKRPKTHKAEPCNLDGKRAVTIWFSMLKMTMPLSSSLVISFLACHQAGAPVLHPSVGTSSISTVHGIKQVKTHLYMF